jgi:AraC-like DNA-binding protein
MLSALLTHGFDICHHPTPPGPHLPCRPTAAGYEQRISERYSWDGMQRGSAPFLVLQHTTYGEGRLDWGAARLRLTPGQTMLVTIPHAHRYWLPPGGHWEYFWLILTGREALRLAHDILTAQGPILTPDAAQTDRLAAAALALLTPQPPGAASAAAWSALATLHEAAFASPPAPDAPDPAPDPALARVLAHIDRHLAEPLPIDRLAALAGLSRAHFVRRFTAATGEPPSAHIRARRIDRADRLLLATELTVTQIAAATGFTDSTYLAKCFRRARGMSPLDWRATRAGMSG